MKLHVFAVLLVVAGAYALPQSSDVLVDEPSNRLSQRNLVEDQIRTVIDLISQVIQRIGLDPVEVEDRSIEFDPSSIDIRIAAFVQGLNFNGLSNIRINALEYSLVFSRLRLDVSLPQISLVVGGSGLEVSAFGRNFEGEFSGSLNIEEIRLAAEVHVDVSLEGITLRSISINFSVGGIQSDLSLVTQGNDRSEALNNLLNQRIPDFLVDNESDINRVLAEYISIILNRIWS